jgi:hypothetical protein
MSWGMASIRFETGAYTLVREHFKLNCNAAFGRKMHFSDSFELFCWSLLLHLLLHLLHHLVDGLTGG